MKKTLSLLFFLFLVASSWAHPWKPRHYVIIDTDGGLDDCKAICMLLASPDVRILAITVSDGFHDDATAYNNIRSMLDGLWHEGLPVARGEEATALIEAVLENEETPVSFIALGSLARVATEEEHSSLFLNKVKSIYWSNDGLPGKEGLNYRVAPEAAEKVLAGPIPVSAAGAGGRQFYDKAFIAELQKTATPYSEKILSVISSNAAHDFVYTAFDEMIPLLLHYPSLFTTTTDNAVNRFYDVKEIKELRHAAVRILSGTTIDRMQAIKKFPADTSFYMSDIQPFVSEIQKRYGEDEWTSGIIANELHRHLGVFAIIGVKMGIRAREYFCTGVDELSVTTFAGSTPPLSCMNDGIQVSTGATPGHGLLKVNNEPPLFPACEFSYHDRVIRISLKKELAQKVISELKEINFIYGLDSDIYWELVRKNSIKYWLDFDRHEIFDIEIIK